MPFSHTDNVTPPISKLQVCKQVATSDVIAVYYQTWCGLSAPADESSNRSQLDGNFLVVLL